jgi:hypothetical protein
MIRNLQVMSKELQFFPFFQFSPFVRVVQLGLYLSRFLSLQVKTSRRPCGLAISQRKLLYSSALSLAFPPFKWSRSTPWRIYSILIRHGIFPNGESGGCGTVVSIMSAYEGFPLNRWPMKKT